MKEIKTIEIIGGNYQGNICKVDNQNEKFLFVTIIGATVLIDIQGKNYRIIDYK